MYLYISLKACLIKLNKFYPLQTLSGTSQISQIHGRAILTKEKLFVRTETVQKGVGGKPPAVPHIGLHWMFCLLGLSLADEWCSTSRKQDIWDRCYHCALEARKKSLSDFLSLLRKPVAGLGQKSHVLLSLLKQEHLEKRVWRVK